MQPIAFNNTFSDMYENRVCANFSKIHFHNHFVAFNIFFSFFIFRIMNTASTLYIKMVVLPFVFNFQEKITLNIVEKYFQTRSLHQVIQFFEEGFTERDSRTFKNDHLENCFQVKN